MSRTPCRRSCLRFFITYSNAKPSCVECKTGPWGPNKNEPIIIGGIKYKVEPYIIGSDK